MQHDRHRINLRVRYQETDQMGVAYYANYLVWFEVARTEFLRAKGISYTDLEKEGFYLVVAESSCTYKSAVKYDDLINITTWISGMKNSSLTFSYRITYDNKEVCTGKTSHVFVNAGFKPVRIPPKIRNICEATDEQVKGPA